MAQANHAIIERGATIAVSYLAHYMEGFVWTPEGHNPCCRDAGVQVRESPY